MSADRRAACAAVSSSVWSVHGRQPRAWAVSEIAVRNDASEPGGLWRAIAGSNSATPSGSWRQLAASLANAARCSGVGSSPRSSRCQASSTRPRRAISTAL